MLQLTTSASDLNEIFSPVGTLAGSCEIIFADDELYIPAADEMSIAMANITVPAESFNRYESDGHQLGLQMEKLTKSLGMAREDDVTHLNFAGEGYLEASVNNKKFVLGLVSLDSVPQQPGVPNIDYGTKFKIERAALSDAVQTAGVFGEKVTLDVDDRKNSLKVKAEGDIDRTEVKIAGGDISTDRLEDISAGFDQKYLEKIVTTVPDDEVATVRLGSKYPLRLSYPIVDGLGTVDFYLAQWKGKSP